MKPIVAVFTFFLLAGCCKVMCIGDEITISFEKFRAVETDTVLFVRYPGNGGTQALDSFHVTTVVSPADTGRSRVAQSISASSHWKIKVPSLNKEYRIENFDFTTAKCNCGGKKYKSVNSFTVNGQRKEGQFLRLEK
ncbi:MAG: hypothetical protein M3Q06_02630 [Bacteroidota bacterium]|nr:hypothetical protein [Bacteroidota bacterium]